MFCYLIIVIPIIMVFVIEKQENTTASKQVTDAEFPKQNVYGTKIKNESQRFEDDQIPS